MKSFILLVLTSTIASTMAFAPLLQRKSALATTTAPTALLSPSALSMAGFGGSGSSKKIKKVVKTTKLMPRQMWDRYLDLKKDTKVRVAVRVNDSEEWLEVGKVKSKGNEFTIVAVARQRALIAEHAKRAYPLLISNKNTLKWGYFKDDGETWEAVDKSVLDNDSLPSGLEKMIGFEGIPEPTGYYIKQQHDTTAVAAIQDYQTQKGRRPL